MTAEAISSKSCNAGEQLQQTVVCTISQWLRQGHCNSLSRATPALRAFSNSGAPARKHSRFFWAVGLCESLGL